MDIQQNKQIPKFLRAPQVLEIIPVSKSTLWERVKTGRFPKPIKLSPGVTVWRAEDIQAYIEGVENEKV